jgi:hypothetical protein
MADCRIPIHGRGDLIVGYALVDPDVVARVGAQRWVLSSGYVRHYGPRVRGVRTSVLLHRAVMGEPPFPGAEVDHVNIDKLDNRRANLRWVTTAQNLQNMPMRSDNASGHRGVYFERESNRWRGEVRVGGRKIWRRRFNDRESAAIATAEARRALLPFATT